jgi:hypothetical protein
MAQQLYENCFVPLLYHELWENIKHDIKSMPIANNFLNIDGDIEIQITEYIRQSTNAPHPTELRVPTTLIHGTYRFQIDLSFTRTFPKLGLCDIVLINIGLQHNRHSFFAIVVHMGDDWPMDPGEITDRSSTDCNDKKHIINVNANVVLYTSNKCSEAIKTHCRRLGRQSIPVVKLSNITSSRRHISAIYNLHKFLKQKSLLKPLDIDPYFLDDLIPDVPALPLGNFNDAQTRVIMLAERIFNGNDRLHLVHGPPGFLLFL